MPVYESGVCDKHGEQRYVLENSGHRRCVRCRSDGVTRYRRNLKIKLVKTFGGKCQICGYDKSVEALEFHHLDSSTKSFGVASKGMSRSFTVAFAEARKCVLLCANCHREVEAGLTSPPPLLVFATE